MRLASFVMSFCLHAGFVVLVLFLPAPSRYKPPPPITVSLVEALPGGSQTPAPALGPRNVPEPQQKAPLPAPPKEAPAPAAPPIPVPETPPPKLEAPKPLPQPVPVPDAALLADKKAEPKQAEAPKPVPPKPEAPKRTSAEEALAQIKAEAAKASRQPAVIADALKVARQKSENAGEGGSAGASVGDVYGARIVMAVQPNWHWPPLARGNLTVALYLKIDAVGRVLDVRVAESSGNPLFDSSAVAAVRSTQTLPPPPGPAYQDIILPFAPMR